MNFHSLQFRFLVLGVLLVVVGSIFRLVVGLPHAQDQLRELVAQQQLSIATYVAHDIDENIKARRTLVGAMAGQLPLALLNDRAQLALWLEDRQRLNPLFDNGLTVIAADGKSTLADYPSVPGREQLDYSRAEWFRAALESRTAVIGHPQRGRASGHPLLIMAAPVRDRDGHALAVLAGVANLSAPGLLGNLQENRLGATGGFLVISPQDKLFVGSSDSSMILRPTPARGINALHDRAMDGYRGTGVTVNAKGIEELSAMVTIPSTGWFVVVRMPTREAFRPIDAMRSYMLKTSAAILVGLIAFLMVVMPRVLRPLTTAALAMRAMADGKRELTPLPIARRDEVGSLLTGFNYLVARLREKEAALEASEARMAYIAHHDALTGLFNRAIFEDRLQQAIARADRDGKSFALLFCDLDGFKPVNDNHGHDVGDAVLVEVAARLSNRRRRIDSVARQGGDEFVVLLADLDNARVDAEQLARQCLAALAAPYEVKGLTLTLSASIGIAIYQGERISGSQLMSRADIAMYAAKHAGKNQISFYDAAASSAQPARDPASQL